MIWWLLGGTAAVASVWWLIRAGAGLFLLEMFGAILEGLVDGIGDILGNIDFGS